ncbi:hypothetical protein BYT27DRAFT_7335144, partial [Phlegmacium glaucopus]
ECKVPRERFLVYPQLALPCNPDQPQDRRAEIPDFAIDTIICVVAPLYKPWV